MRDVLTAMQWACAVLGAVMVGVSKTGISGLGILAVALFAFVFPSAQQASGVVLSLEKLSMDRGRRDRGVLVAVVISQRDLGSISLRKRVALAGRNQQGMSWNIRVWAA